MGHVVFIPGIMGSELKIKDARKWPVVLPSAVKEISLVKHPDIMDSAPLLVYVKQFYSVIHKQFDKEYSKSYDFFHYDWRQNLLTTDTFERLKGLLEGKTDVTIVAHSMGGLLTRLFVKWCLQEGYNVVNNIKNVITLATPWRGTPDALWKLYYGEPHPMPTVPLTSAAIMKELASTFPSVYQLLPHIDKDNQKDLVFNPNENYNRYLHINEIVANLFDDNQKEMYRNVAKNFAENVQGDWPDWIRSYAVVGQGYATAKTIVTPVIYEKDHYYEKEKILMGSGDRTVPVNYALPYDQKTVCRFTKASHVGIVKDKKVINWLKAIIGGKEEDFYGDFKHVPSEKFSGQIIKIACPVKVSVYTEGNTLIAGEAKDLFELKQQLDYITDEIDDSDSDVMEDFMVFGDTTYYFRDERKNDVEYKIEGKEQGTASVEVIQYEQGDIAKVNIFPSIEVKEGMISTLHFESMDNILLNVNNSKEIEPLTFTPEISRDKVRPLTKASYELQYGSELKIEDKIIIQAPLKFMTTYGGITKDEYLETRIIHNHKKLVTVKNEFIIYPTPGPNEIIIYTVSKYGMIDEKPLKYTFIYDTEPPRTNYTMMLFSDKIQVFLNAKDDSMGKVTTKYSYKQEKNTNDKVYEQDPITAEYDNEVIKFYSIDQIGNKEIDKHLELPNELTRRSLFISKFERYEQILEALGLADNTVSIFANNREVSRETKVRKTITNISIHTIDGNIISLVFKQELDILWINHPTEVLSAKDQELYTFSFKIVSENGFVKNDYVKVKLVPKGPKLPSSELEIKYDETAQEYFGRFGTSIVPRNISEGKIQVVIKNKVYRESKFKIMD